MSDSIAARTAAVSLPRSGKPLRHLLFAAAAALLLAGVGIPLLAAHWPFRYRNVEPMLEKVFASKIKMDQYHCIYFPSPGFVATGLTLRRNSAPDLPPLGSADTLLVQGSWIDLLLLRRRISLVAVDGLHIVIPPVGSRANREDFPPGSTADFGGPSMAVEHFNVRNGLLEIMREEGGSFAYPIRQLSISNLQKGKTTSYTLDMQNARPSGHILSTGRFGPVLANNLGATVASGEFTFAPVQLSDVHGISGSLSSRGRFGGGLQAIEADITADIPDFAVGHGTPTHIAASARGAIDALNGDITIHNIEVRTGETTVVAQGDIAGSPKLTQLKISVSKGRAQDLLQPFLHDPSPVTGPVWLQSHATIGAAEKGSKFLQRLQMDGTFDIPREHLTNHAAEQKLSAFSRRAQDASTPRPGSIDPDANSSASADVLSSLRGQATIRNGIVLARRLIFKLPGADVDLNGTFSLRTRDAHLLGDVRMQSDISHVTTGFKSFLLKPLAPFFRKNKAGATISIAITGSPNHYKISQNVLGTK